MLNERNRMVQRVYKEAFSLIEVMIAVAIIGIMAAMVGPSLVKYFGRAKRVKPTQHLQA